MNPRLLIYSHDALGLGHLRRSLAIARAVLARRPDASVLLVTCSPVVDRLAIPAGLDYVKLPSARKVANQSYTARSLRIGEGHLRDLRAAIVRDVALEFRPDVLLVDKSPAGLMGELRPTLAAMRRARPEARLVLGWRDILDEPHAVRAEWSSGDTLELVERHYDELWVYGDPSVYDVRSAYAMPRAVADRVRYLGYLVPSPDAAARGEARRRHGREGRRLAVVTAGGGEDGAAVFERYFAAAHAGALPPDLDTIAVLGPCMPPEAAHALRDDAPAGVAVHDMLPDLAPLLAAADVVVGMAGYNTTCEVLGAGVPAVLMPRTRPRREQWIRARALEARGAVACVEPDAATPAVLGRAVCEVLGSAGSPARLVVDAGGLARAAERVEELFEPRRSHAARVARAAGGLP